MTERGGSVRADDAAIRAVVLDLDGVITRTADVHYRAWKRLFDEVDARLRERGEGGYERFDEAAYRRHVDGLPRRDGLRAFLEARHVHLPDGAPDDPADRLTLHGLARRKNEMFQALLREEGVTLFDEVRPTLERWRRDGLALAVVSSSRNCGPVLEAAGATGLFDVRVDGLDLAEGDLEGKPAPDLFLEAARRLDVLPRQAVVFEDAVAGVEAGRAGGFARVIGVNRGGDGEDLRRAGADQVVTRLDEATLDPPDRPPRALDSLEEISERLGPRRPAAFLDYDGTLTPIVPRPEDAVLSDAMRRSLRRLADRVPVAIVSGRDRPDVAAMVGLDDLVYAGSHGFDIAGPGGLHHEHPAGVERLPDLDAAQRALESHLADVEGCQVERKRFAIAVHFRNVAPGRVDEVEAAVDEVLSGHEEALRKTGGKKIFELRPRVEWDKGRAVTWLLDALDLDRPDVVPLYVGDDVTDEDAFRALSGRGLGLVVGEVEGSAADYVLADVDEARRFLDWLATRSDGEATP
ncbi:MAG: trehalose-phosphatase [Myxococcota bacterium]